MATYQEIKGMKRLRSILVVFNGSDLGSNTLRQAIRLANRGGCEVAVAIVLPSNEGRPVLVGVKSVKEVDRRPGERIFSEGLRKVEENPQIQTILEGSNIHEAIIDVAKERDCDLIVMGRKGIKDLARTERSFMKNIIGRVIGYSPIDVLVMPSDTELRWGNILLAVDNSKYSEIAAEKALKVARHHRGDLKVVSVVNVPDEAYGDAPGEVEKMINRTRALAESIKNKAEETHIRTEVYIKEGEPHEKIVDLANKLKADIICMGSYGRRGLRKLFMGSVTEKVIEKSPCPVLVVKNA